jgi:uncharacterized protein (TIGR00297 family)
MTYTLLIVAVIANGALAAVAYWRAAVTLDGAVAGLIVGAGILLFGGWTAWLCLGSFFVTSSLASRVGSSRKTQVRLIQEKGDRRDALQVLANGGVGFLAALGLAASLLLARRTGGAFGGTDIWMIAIAAAFAEANADTWSSELGVLSRRRPVSLVSRRPVMPGMSGGVTAAGFAAAAGGALLIAAVFAAGLLAFTPERSYALLAFEAGVVALAGWAGSIVDSLLGATLQPLFLVPGTGDLTERKEGAAGRNARVGGLSFMSNDMINFLSTLISAAVAATAGALLSNLFVAMR